MNPYQKVDWINLHHGEHLKTLGKELKAVAVAKWRFDRKADAILDIMDRAAALVAPQAACKRGCAFCCYQTVIIFDWEADRMERLSGVKRNGYKGHGMDYTPEKHEQTIAKYHGVICPFLKNNECSVYFARPMACRLHFSVADDAELCNLETNPGAKVPYFNFHPWIQVSALIFLKEGRLVADIREFFGER